MADRMEQNRGVRRTLTIAVLAAAVAIAGCSKKSERVYFNGNYYPAKARAADKSDRQTFTVAVRRADQGLAGAREAGRYGGKQYCLKNYGTSEIEWTVGPDAPDAALGRSRGSSIVFSGRCILW